MMGDSLPHLFLVFVNGVQLTDIQIDDSMFSVSYPNQTSEVIGNVYNTNVYHAISNSHIVEVKIKVIQNSQSDIYLDTLMKTYFSAGVTATVNYNDITNAKNGTIIKAGFTAKPEVTYGSGIKVREYTLQGREI